MQFTLYITKVPVNDMFDFKIVSEDLIFAQGTVTMQTITDVYQKQYPDCKVEWVEKIDF